MQENEKTPASLDIEEKKDVVEQDINDVKVVKTDIDSKDGQNKCPHCGSTDITTNIKTGKLRCLFCRNEFEPERVAGLEKNLKKLSGTIIGSGASDIISDSNDIITFKCDSCGAEVVVDTNSANQARCHWCRNMLSINKQIPNGSIPDVVLPFKLSKEEAETIIQKFVNKRRFYAHPKFIKEFTTSNIMGVYLPYMIIDVNAHAKLDGQGEHLVRSYTVEEGDRHVTYYDADLYNVSREYDIVINGLTIESNSDKINNTSSDRTNNVINAIMPFDTENCVKYNSNYLRGFTSEKRDINIEKLKPLVETQAKDISRFAANNSLKHYNRGVCWKTEKLDIHGEQWQAAYLPIWLYSYQQVNNNKSLLHYVAVNARTKEVMGSVPIHMPKLLFISTLVEILGIIMFLFINSDEGFAYLLFLVGFIYFGIIYSKYRNSGARHHHETETKTELDKLEEHDEFVRHETKLRNATIHGANNKRVLGSSNKSIMNAINDFVDK